MAFGIAAEGTLLQIGDGSSPQNYTTIANVQDITGLGLKATEVDITSHSSNTVPWRQKLVTLLDLGQVTAKCFFDPAAQTHKNAPGGASPNPLGGIRYLFVNRLKATYRILRPDGTSDQFAAYVSQCSNLYPVAGVMGFDLTLSATDNPVSLS